MSVKDVFLDLVSYPTASDETTGTTPSTPGQKVLGAHIVEHMKSIGIADARMDEMGYVYGTIPATAERGTTVGFIAHMDTYGGVSGENIHPQVIENYNGGAIALGGSGLSLSPAAEPALLGHVGKTLITTDGTTLLGGDDKAGVAEIMTMLEQVIKSGIPHGRIAVGFTPDEEIGAGANGFDVKGFGCDFAYTVDGGEEGGIDYENFNAASADFTVHGFNVHPGSSKNTMINASLVAMEINAMLPSGDTPRDTEGYEGFFHLCSMSGNVEKAALEYIVRDHSATVFDARLETLRHIQKLINEKYGEGTAELTIREQYRNMIEMIRPCIQVVDYAKEAIREAGLEPIVEPIRGGTDGARLSYMGLPCPNLGTGGYAAHGPYEHVTVEGMEKCTEILVNIVKRCAKA